MAIVAQKPLFSWDAVDVKTDLERLELALQNLPDEKLMRELETIRGHGQNKFPIRPMWNAVVAGVVFQHPSIESLRRELGRNPSLMQCCGFTTLPLGIKPKLQLIACQGIQPETSIASKEHVNPPTQLSFHSVNENDVFFKPVNTTPDRSKTNTKSDTKKNNKSKGKSKIPDKPPHQSDKKQAKDGYLDVPSAWVFSRFLKNLIDVNEKHDFTGSMMTELRHNLMEVLPDFGRYAGADGKGIQSHSTGQKNKESGNTSDTDADWGHHETSGVDAKTGKMWSKVKSWFGYTVHVIADTQYEIPLSVEVTPASHSEQTTLRIMLKKLYKESPGLASRCSEFSADRGYDSAESKALLWDDYQIRPLVDTRLMWRAEKEEPGYDPEKPITRPLFPDRCDTIVYTERGTVHCICPGTGELRDMAFQGFESGRNTIKYRCPAAAYGTTCPGQAACHKAGGVQPGEYGRIVRIDLNTSDRRIFTPTPHGSPSWERGYNRRSALERINNRIDNSFCFEKHFIRGLGKMKVRVGLAMCVMMSMALGHVKAGRHEQMRSLVQPIGPPAKAA